MTLFRTSTTICSLLLALLSVFWVPTLAAQEMTRFGESARSLAMGGALTALADGFDAMLYNPAGLAQSTSWQTTLTTWQEASFSNAGGRGDIFFRSLGRGPGIDQTAVNTFLDTAAGVPQTARDQNFFGFHTANGFGVAYYDTTRRHAQPADPNDPSGSGLDLTYDRLTASVFTFAFPTKRKLFSWGFSLKSLTREGDKRLAVSGAEIFSPGVDPRAATAGNSAYTIDVGLFTRIPSEFFRATFGIAMLNGIAPDFGLPDLDPILPEVNVGLAIMPDLFGKNARLVLAADLRDVTQSAFPNDPDSGKRAHYGMEVSLFPQQTGAWLLSLRAGTTQGLSSFGAGFMLRRWMTVDFVSYEEEMGPTGGASLPQRRYLLQATLGLGALNPERR